MEQKVVGKYWSIFLFNSYCVQCKNLGWSMNKITTAGRFCRDSGGGKHYIRLLFVLSPQAVAVAATAAFNRLTLTLISIQNF
ncbi:unnamed protein product [Arabidopsis lyrata]|uniref:Predicted protein n=1 Tax=Arabidopsis lyrata subsp. lyrata TaxID=81972 RepID=D7M499_ARALL|nr:predicted protein [Arabidopsis lyrata subsp. lyrata]CAH8273503.1 unnamed protein product [Arabidopsis lyrata]